MKTTAAVLGSFVAVVVLCWAIGLVEYTYPKVFTNQPVQHPRRVVEIAPTNMLLDNGQLIRLLPGMVLSSYRKTCSLRSATR